MNRNIKMDNYKGILIYLVVLGHLLFSFTYYNKFILLSIVKFIYSFHMPLFLIISGFFSKKVTKDSLLKLFILFILLNVSYSFYDYIIKNTFDLFFIKYSAWYLLALFIYRFLIYIPNVRLFITNNKKKSLILLFAVSIFGGLFNIGGVLTKIVTYFFFFVFGFLWDNKKSVEKFKKNDIYLITGLLIGMLLFLSFSLPFSLDFYLASSYWHWIQVIFRFLIFGIDILLFLCLYFIIPNKKIIFITNIGKNSLIIYFFHRIFTLIITDYFIQSNYFVFIALTSSILLCLLFGNNFFVNLIKKISNYFCNLFKQYTILSYICLIILIFLLVGFNFKKYIMYYYNSIVKTEIVNYDTQEDIDDNISLGFVGDLILLENQVNNYFNDGVYNFDYMFKYTNKYFNEVDYMMGVLEGPVDDNKIYSIGNFDDNKELKLNYPSEFLDSIKNSGIDLVTTANNHLLDNGIDSAYETINNLERKNLDFIGSYRNKSENLIKRRKIVTIDGLKLGILTYTYGINNLTEDELIDNYLYLSNYLCSSNSKYFTQIKKQVDEDFRYLDDNDVDYIIVLPHYGTQFMNEADDYQRFWNDIFIENGADVILGAHSHHVQPIEYKDGAVIVNSVGNYVNSYIGYDGDISIMVKVFLHKKEKKVSAVSVIPLLAVSNENNAYYSVPLYEAYNNDDLSDVKIKYSNRIKYANKLIGKVILNTKISISNMESEYLFINGKYKKKNNYIFKITDDDKNSVVYQKINNNDSICFVGDSITEGTKNLYHPWYEELVNLFGESKDIFNFSKGGYTTSEIISEFGTNLSDSSCSLVIINIGTNDIRYYERSSIDYELNIRKILSYIDDRDIILLSPWRTTSNDFRLKNNKAKKIKLYDEYDEILMSIDSEYDNVIFINGNNYINKVITEMGEELYLLDGIHPNSDLGVKLYSYSVLRN